MDRPPYRCICCGKFFVSPQAMNDHYDSWEHFLKFDDMLLERRYRCDICFNRFETKSDFEMHVSVYHEDYPAHAILTLLNSAEDDSEEETNEKQNQQGGQEEKEEDSKHDKEGHEEDWEQANEDEGEDEEVEGQDQNRNQGGQNGDDDEEEEEGEDEEE